MTKKRIKSASLFEAGELHGNVVLNFMERPLEEFDIYAHAFHTAAKGLVETMRSASGYSDADACPIVFLYRHALELYLKAMLVTGDKYLRLSSKKGIFTKAMFSNHRLISFLPAIREIIDATRWGWDMGVDGLRTYADFENLIIEMDRVDPNSYTFRYPVDTAEKAALPTHFMLNVFDFASRLDPLLNAFDGATTGLEEMYQAAAEASYLSKQR